MGVGSRERGLEDIVSTDEKECSVINKNITIYTLTKVEEKGTSRI